MINLFFMARKISANDPRPGATKNRCAPEWKMLNAILNGCVTGPPCGGTGENPVRENFLANKRTIAWPADKSGKV